MISISKSLNLMVYTNCLPAFVRFVTMDILIFHSVSTSTGADGLVWNGQYTSLLG